MSDIRSYNMLGGIPPDPVYHCADDSLDEARLIEEYADSLMDKCKAFKRAEALNSEHDLFDGDFLPKLMVEIANWKGGPESALVHMKRMFNLLADALEAIAKKECA